MDFPDQAAAGGYMPDDSNAIQQAMQGLMGASQKNLQNRAVDAATSAAKAQGRTPGANDAQALLDHVSQGTGAQNPAIAMKLFGSLSNAGQQGAQQQKQDDNYATQALKQLGDIFSKAHPTNIDALAEAQNLNKAVSTAIPLLQQRFAAKQSALENEVASRAGEAQYLNSRGIREYGPTTKYSLEGITNFANQGLQDISNAKQQAMAQYVQSLTPAMMGSLRGQQAAFDVSQKQQADALAANNAYKNAEAENMARGKQGKVEPSLQEKIALEAAKNAHNLVKDIEDPKEREAAYQRILQNISSTAGAQPAAAQGAAPSTAPIPTHVADAAKTPTDIHSILASNPDFTKPGVKFGPKTQAWLKDRGIDPSPEGVKKWMDTHQAGQQSGVAKPAEVPAAQPAAPAQAPVAAPIAAKSAAKYKAEKPEVAPVQKQQAPAQPPGVKDSKYDQYAQQLMSRNQSAAPGGNEQRDNFLKQQFGTADPQQVRAIIAAHAQAAQQMAAARAAEAERNRQALLAQQAARMRASQMARAQQLNQYAAMLLQSR